MRRFLVAPIVALALAAAGQAAAAQRATDRGLIVSVRPAAIVIRELDGGLRRFRIGAATIVMLDGQPATVLDLQRGEVAYVQYFGARPAFRIRAFTQ